MRPVAVMEIVPAIQYEFMPVSWVVDNANVRVPCISHGYRVRVRWRPANFSSVKCPVQLFPSRAIDGSGRQYPAFELFWLGIPDRALCASI